MSGSSSSNEDDYERIKEAVDEEFLTDDIYRSDESKGKKPEAISKPQSFRNQRDQALSVNPFTVKVTAEFQKHVSKHLSKLLDELIDDTEIILIRKPKEKKLNFGVKLLHSSKNYLVLADRDKTCIKQKNITKKRNLHTIDFEKRAKEVAVTSDWILSKAETRHWAPDTKSEIEIVKFGNYKKLPKKISRHR